MQPILHEKNQRGISLIITFIIITIMLAIVLSVSTLLFSQIKVLGNIGNSVSAFYAAYTGVERTLYFDRKQITAGAPRGLCTLCSSCGPSCQTCTATPLDGVAGGCNATQCSNCQVNYTADYDGRTYSVTASVIPDTANPGSYILTIRSQGFYRDTTRAVELTSN